MRKRNLFSISISLILCMSVLAGCGAGAGENAEEVIELVEPVEAGIIGTEPVVRRDLYVAEIFEGTVYPYVEEYSFSENQTFGRFGAYPGDAVKQGDILAYADDTKILERIENMEERLKTLKENYEEFCRDAEESLNELQYNMEVAEWVLGNLDIEKPAQYITGANSAQTVNPKYTSWERDYKKWKGQFTSAELKIDMKNQEMLEKKELYDIDYAYYYEQLQKLKAQKEEGIITSQMSGTVVAINSYNEGSLVSRGVSVIAVGDMNRKLLKCEYITKRRISESEAFFAFVEGKKYEVVYQDDGNKEQTSFVIQDEDNRVSIGDNAVLVRYRKSRKQVLTVSVDAIYSSGTQKMVYVVEDGEVIERPVKTGVSNGVYTEITSGLEEGEQILVAEVTEPGAQTAVLEKGDFTAYSVDRGSVYFPNAYYVENPYKNVSVNFVKHLVEYSDWIEAGDAVTLIDTEGDEVALIGMEQELQREKERLADLITAGNTKEETITRKQESITKQEEELKALRDEYEATTIYAPVSGRIEYTATFSGTTYDGKILTGEIAKNAVVARIVDTSVGFLRIQNENGYLKYGDELIVEYYGPDGFKRETTGWVVTIDSGGLSDAFKNMSMLVVLPEGEIDQVRDKTKIGDEAYKMSRIDVWGNVSLMDNVIVVPRGAVTVRNGDTFVNVLQEDGTVLEVQFLAGGSNKQYYWVIEGLTEGMTICWG